MKADHVEVDPKLKTANRIFHSTAFLSPQTPYRQMPQIADSLHFAVEANHRSWCFPGTRIRDLPQFDEGYYPGDGIISC